LQTREQFIRTFQDGHACDLVRVPGRVNLIGEHIDYHRLPVLPVAIRRYIEVAYRRRDDRLIRAAGEAPYGRREFEWTESLATTTPGDWENYLRAAAQAVTTAGWAMETRYGIDAAVSADLPAAAGLSSSSALIVAFTLALARANGYQPAFDELMAILPEGEHFVGTRGGGMDHAAVLGSRADCASLIEFDPASVTPVPLPAEWQFLVAHSLQVAEKSGGAREEYNARRQAGSAALERMGLRSYPEAIREHGYERLMTLAAERLECVRERDSFLHTVSEAARVRDAVGTICAGRLERFGKLLTDSHRSLRERLHVSVPALDELVEAGLESGAAGARLTGAGFGGCVVMVCSRADAGRVRRGLIERYYSGKPSFEEGRHLLDADAGPGVLFAEEG
jgi:galactokinase